MPLPTTTATRRRQGRTTLAAWLPWLGPRGAKRIRQLPDPFAVPARASGGSRPSEESYRLAQDMTVVLGPEDPVIDHYLKALSLAPPTHLELLRQTNGALVFAPTIADALRHEDVTVRRAYPIDPDDDACDAEDINNQGLQAGLYEPNAHVLAFPTDHRADDLEHVALHELGHALTYRAADSWATSRADLLDNLPPEIHDHVFQDAYEVPGNLEETTRARVHEALADGYMWIVAGRDAELSANLCRAIFDAIHDASTTQI